MMPRRILFILFLSIAGFIASVSAADSAPQSSVTTIEQAQVEQRAQTYLESLKIRDLQTAYQMESGSTDGSLTADAFRRLMTSAPAELLDYQIRKVSIEDVVATIEFNATYQYPQLHDPYTSPRRFYWMLIDGQWYHKSNGQGLKQTNSSQP